MAPDDKFLMVNGMTLFQSALRFAVAPAGGKIRCCGHCGAVSIRFEVRGGSRPVVRGRVRPRRVSIRFEVRGGSRHFRPESPQTATFQSALRFAVAPGGGACGPPTAPSVAGFNPL